LHDALSVTSVIAFTLRLAHAPSCSRNIDMSGSRARWETVLSAAVVVCCVFSSGAPAQSAADSAARKARHEKFATIEWLTGPSKGRLGSIGEINVPKGCRLTQETGAKTYLELSENIPSDEEVGLLLCEDRQQAHWFVVYTYDPSGYVKDDEKTTLNADTILATLRKGEKEDNEERRKRGWSALHIQRWVRPPYYDEKTHNLTWSFALASSDSSMDMNESVRLLGRGGVLHADLVLSPSQVDSVVPQFDSIVSSTTFVPGSRYSEWKSGDKVAEFGLTALIAGGASAAALKSGLFAKLGAALAAGWKVIAAAFVALSTRLKNLFKRKPKSGNDNV
jgi:uncharacterized membrane-anchored protein